jgi:hypothetical protein
MSVELIGTGKATHMVLPELPAVISPETLGESRSDDADPNYLCLISQVDDHLVVWDLGGKSGTFVNGSRVKRATLKDCDTLGFGGNEFRVHNEPPTRRYVFGPRN